MQPHEVVALLGYVTMRDLMMLGRLRVKELVERDFFIEFLDSKLQNTPIDSDTLNSWSDEFLTQVLNQWIRRGEFDGEPKVEVLSLADAKQYFFSRVDSHAKLTAEILKSSAVSITEIMGFHLPDMHGAIALMTESAVYQPALHALAKIESLNAPSKALSAIQDALVTASASSHILELTALSDTSENNLARVINAFSARDVINHVTGLGEVLERNASFGSLIQNEIRQSALVSVSAITEKLLSAFEWGKIGSIIGLDAIAKVNIRGEFLSLSSSYAGLIKAWDSESPRTSLLGLVHLPSLEYFSGVDVLEGISNNEYKDLEFRESRLQKRDELALETNDALKTLLLGLDGGLIPMLEGARQAVKSNNVDKARHVSISLRELLMHILHILAPDDEIRLWSSDPSHFDKGKPTRKARLHYICRSLNCDSLRDFMEQDIKTTLELYNLLHRGTHIATGDYTYSQLQALIVKTESAIRFLMEIAQIDD